MFSSLQEEMTSRVREGRRRKKAQKQSDDEDELNTSDCEVFQCGAASVGHLAYRSHLDLKEKTVYINILKVKTGVKTGILIDKVKVIGDTNMSPVLLSSI